jgi:hypothetical protein
LREICPRKKDTPKIGANIGAITGILLSIAGSRMLKLSSKPRTGSWGLILGQSASFGSFFTSGDPDPACAVFILGVRTVVVLSDTLGGDALSSLFGASVLRLDNISVIKLQLLHLICYRY